MPVIIPMATIELAALLTSWLWATVLCRHGELITSLPEISPRKQYVSEARWLNNCGLRTRSTAVYLERA